MGKFWHISILALNVACVVAFPLSLITVANACVASVLAYQLLVHWDTI